MWIGVLVQFLHEAECATNVPDDSKTTVMDITDPDG